MKIKVNHVFGGFFVLIVAMMGVGALANLAVNKGYLGPRSAQGFPVSGPDASGTASPYTSRAAPARTGLRRTPIDDLSYEAEQAFTGNKIQDACICYERAFLTSSSLIEARARSLSRGDEYTSVAYISGYKACRGAVQEAGGSYWAHGWELGKEGKFWRAKCPLGRR